MGYSDAEKWNRFLSGGFWFVAVFLVVLVILIVDRPGFFLNWVNPVLVGTGIHPLWEFLAVSANAIFREWGFFLLFALILVFWWVFFFDKTPAEKESQKKEGKSEPKKEAKK